MAKLCENFFFRFRQILENEYVGFEQKDAADLIVKYAPDWRRVLNEAQRSGVNGQLVLSSRVVGNSDQYNLLFQLLKAKDFKKMRTWVVNNMDVDAAAIFRGIYDNMQTSVSQGSIPQLVLILADYQYKNAFVADHELNIVACCTEIMANVEFT